MIVKMEEFLTGYVVVPTFCDGGFGVNTVDRGDMTDDEWKRWRRISQVKDLIKFIADYNKAKKPVGKLSGSIAKFLTDSGVSVCRIYQPRP